MNPENSTDLIYLTEHYGLLEIKCKTCNYKEIILSRFEAFSRETDEKIIQLGFQCQMCGKFTRRFYYPGKTI